MNATTTKNKTYTTAALHTNPGKWINEIFDGQPKNKKLNTKYNQLRKASTVFAKTITKITPAGSKQKTALNAFVQAMSLTGKALNPKFSV